MSRVLFSNIRIFDGTGAPTFPGQVLVEDNRIVAVTRGSEPLDHGGATIVDGEGATLMPGLVEAHAHVSFPHAMTFEEFGKVPPEEHTLITAYNAKRLLDAGFTSAYSGASAKPRLDVVIRNEINAGRIPGPRLRAASPEVTSTGGFGDFRRMHQPDIQTFEWIADGPIELRRTVRMLAREGVETIKMNLSGENAGRAGMSERLGFTNEETAAAADQAREWGLDLACHAQAAASVKMAVRHGFRMIYHCGWADDEALDLLESKKHELFVAPAVGLVYATAHDADKYDVPKQVRRERGAQAMLERYIEVYAKIRKRGIRVLPGGDYGFAWNPIGNNARDLEHFVKLFGYTAHEVLRAATMFGGDLMHLGGELGQVKAGYLADLLLVDGDPTEDVAILQDHDRLLMIMKDGTYHKAPRPRTADRARRLRTA